MANDTIWVYAAQVTLATGGVNVASSGFAQSTSATLSTANHSNYPWADFSLQVNGFGAVLASNVYVNLYRQDLDIDGTADAVVPGSTFPETFVGTFRIPNTESSASTNYFSLTNVPLAKNCQFSIENKCGQTMTSGWVLKATPKTYTPSA